MPKKLEDMTLQELEAEEARLAKERTRIRLEQNAVTAALTVRRALDAAGISGRVVKITLDGGVTAKGGTQ